MRKPDAIAELAGHGVPGVWLQSITTLLAVTEDLDRQLAVLDGELRPVARADDRVRLLMSIPGIGELLGLTIASEIGDIARFPQRAQARGYSGPVPRLLGARPAGRPRRRPSACADPSAEIVHVVLLASERYIGQKSMATLRDVVSDKDLSLDQDKTFLEVDGACASDELRSQIRSRARGCRRRRHARRHDSRRPHPQPALRSGERSAGGGGGSRLHERSALTLAILDLDLDRFKAINDRYDHPVGHRSSSRLPHGCTR